MPKIKNENLKPTEASEKEVKGFSTKEMMSMITAMREKMDEMEKKENSYNGRQVVTSEYDRWVTIVHLCERTYPLTTTIRMPDGKEWIFSKFGDTASMRYNEFEELVRIHRGLFDKNVICLAEKDGDLSEKFGLNVGYRKGLTSSMLDGIMTMSDEEIEKIYKKVAATQKETIIQKVMAGYWDKESDGRFPKDKMYNNKNKVMLLDRLSDGALKDILDDMEFRKN